MTTYRVKATYNQALVDLTVLSPQPDPGPGIQTTRRTHGGDSSVTDEARYIELHFSALDDATAYQALLTLFGLSASVEAAAVTVYIRDETYAWVRLNGDAIRPIPGKTVKWGAVQSRPLDIKLLVKNLAAVS